MTYDYVAWPSWAHGPKGESAIFNSEDEVPKGWTHHEKKAPEKPANAAHGASKADQHTDPHNVPSASEEAVAEAAKPVAPIAAEGKEELDGLRAHYKKVMGKKAFPGWNADTLREKMHEAGK